ncbi:tetratricopeptide repeat protein [Actinoplanes sp. CA-030573]|uniref:tetratricopeptide repeat protein n=1 Tax=Actinoplanes sp. CA-030573 TaxID=3239898 RepID=UPI003D94462B
MTDPYGHADAAALEAAARREMSLLELAQLWIEPMHREDDAAELVETFLRVSPGNPRAVVLSAYLALHYWMDDEHLDAAADGLRDVLDRGAEVGAAAMLLDEILRQRGPDPADATVELLRRSVAAEPSWSLNHVRLARAYAARGDIAAARSEFDAAIANILDTVPDPVAESFHTLFTGCLNDRSRVVAERARLG